MIQELMVIGIHFRFNLMHVAIYVDSNLTFLRITFLSGPFGRYGGAGDLGEYGDIGEKGIRVSSIRSSNKSNL